MRWKIGRLLLLSITSTVALAADAFAKPPGASNLPETEFRVLSPLAQEYFEPAAAPAPLLVVPTALASPAAAAAIVIGGAVTVDSVAATDHRWLGWQASMRWLYRSKANGHRLEWNDKVARDVYDMAEIHRLAGDWEEAKRWYAGVKEMYPRSVWAPLADARLERFALLRIAAEAGEEQSEEPPEAGAERLIAPPRVVSP